MTHPQPTRPDPERSLRRLAIVLVPLAAMLALSIPLLLDPASRGRAGDDELSFHLRVVESFGEQWPRPDLSDYLSATTPGHHLLTAAWGRLLRAVSIEPTTPALRVPTLALSLALVTLLAWWCARPSKHPDEASPPAWAALLALPLACSMYVAPHAAYILPDNAGWLLLLTTLLSSLLITRRGAGPRLLAMAGVSLLLLVAFRQSHIWAAAAIWTAAWLANPPTSPSPSNVFIPTRARITRAAIALAVTAPAAALVGWFWVMWGAPVPPAVQTQHASGANFSNVPLLLALAACFGPFFAAAMTRSMLQAFRSTPGSGATLAGAAILGIALAAIPETTYVNTDRAGGFWNIVKATPYIATHTSVVILLLAPIGATLLAWMLLTLPTRPRWVMAAALVAFAAAQSANPVAWQRYIEPFLLLWLALVPATILRLPVTRTTHRWEPRAALAALLALSVAMFAFTLVSVRAWRPTRPHPIDRHHGLFPVRLPPEKQEDPRTRHLGLPRPDTAKPPAQRPPDGAYLRAAPHRSEPTTPPGVPSLSRA